MTPDAVPLAVEQLRYVRLGTRDLDAAATFATEVLGLEAADRTEARAAFRSDNRAETLVFLRAEVPHAAVGLEVRDDAALARAVDALRRAGVAVTPGTPEEAAERRVRALARFCDPVGHAFELVVRPLHCGARFFPARDAGVTGLAAVALRCPAPAEAIAFWTTLSQARLVDWIGDGGYLAFDAERHHRLALHETASGAGLLAVEFAVDGVDQLMRSAYLLRAQQVRIAAGPGRRPASGEMFLTLQGPDGVLFSFLAEGGLRPDPATPPRQFPRLPSSYCAWGSGSEVPEFCGRPGDAP
ncbi:VOC family protein [Paracraurococcus lichenis]|uniref:VOC family protein n=1 Tax=Paracraurococcus lichenis TaxID=3064888 RepID=A0ABT9ECR9_9PROT|nr:VOC family protein [Paracraurococcus sp. LOR1-02]MDO9714007.1 VOC family protein [Paracraurococcus sp. LOR1-02]